MIRQAILRWARNRKPDFVIGGTENPYLRRHWLIPRNPFFNVYVHEFLRSDDDRALHDHPWLFNATWVLDGAYREWRFLRDYWFSHAHSEETVACRRETGDFAFRWGKAPHRVELPIEFVPVDGPQIRVGMRRRCWTLFITGPRVRVWGFYCPKGWIHWKQFTAPSDKGQIGKGCDE